MGKEKGTQSYQRVNQDTAISKYESDDFDVLFKLLLSGRIDTIMGAHRVLSDAIQSRGLEKSITYAAFEPKLSPGHFVFSKSSVKTPMWHPVLEQRMKEIQENGELEQLIHKGSIVHLP